MADYFIDPSSSTNGSGLISNPLNQFPPLSAYNRYFLKRGTTFRQSAALAIAANDITIGTYGVGDKPILDAQNSVTSNITVAGCANIVVGDLSCINATNVNGAIVCSGTTNNVQLNALEVVGKETCVLVSGTGCTNIVINGGIFDSPQCNNQCIEFSTPGAGCKISSSTITFLGSDKSGASLIGVYANGGSPVEIGYNTIVGFGQGVESRCDSAWVHHNDISYCYTSGARVRDALTNILEFNNISYIWNGFQYDGGAGAGSGGGAGAGIDFLDVSTAVGNNIARYNKILYCYQGILDQADVTGGNKYYSNFILYSRVNGISCQSKAGIAYAWFNTIIHHPLDSVTPTGHGLVVQNGGVATTVNFKYNLIVCEIVGANIQCINIGGTAGTHYLSVTVDRNIYYAQGSAHIGSIGGLNYDTLSAWQTALGAVAQVVVKDPNSLAGDPGLTAEYVPTLLGVEKGQNILGVYDVNGNFRKTLTTIGAFESNPGVKRQAA